MPWLLGGPGMLWLGAFFLIPLVRVLALSIQTCDAWTLQCTQSWNFGIFGEVLSTYHTQFIRSLAFGGAATIIDLIVAFPVAYWIAFRGGNRKNFYLLILLLPFFVSFVIRTLAWKFLLADQGFILTTPKNLHLLPPSYHVLATSTAVIGGIAYNFLPFTALPLYVALERIDPRVLEAARDLYSNNATVFRKVILPLSVPGIFAAFLLTFVPAVGDFVNAQILGGVNTTMIGNVIQDKFLTNLDYPAAAALSTILLVAMLIGILAYGKVLGSRTIEEYV